MKKIKVGIIGLGYWGPNILRNVSKIQNISITYAADLLDKNLQIVTKQYPGTRITKNYREMLENDSLDAVIIATPTHTHFSIAKDALLANKHVLLEKPCTTKSSYAKKLVSIADKKSRIFMASFPFVYSEAVKKMKTYIDKKSLGKLFYYDSTRVNLGIIRQDIDVMWDLAIHDLSILQFLLTEKPLAVLASGSHFITPSQTELSHISIRYPSGFIAQIHVSWLSPLKIRTIMLGGSKKMVVFDDINPIEKIKIYEKGIDLSADTPLSPLYRTGKTISPHLNSVEPLENELRHFFECIQTQKKPITHGEKAVEILKILEALNMSLQRKTWVHVRSL